MLQERALWALMTAFILTLSFGYPFIGWAKKNLTQPIRDDGPKTHLKKQGTPTMGGVFVLASIFISTLIFSKWNSPYLWIMVITTLSYATLGFLDDYLKIVKKNTKGVSGHRKLFWQFLIAGIMATWTIYLRSEPSTLSVVFPFIHSISIPLGILYVTFAALVIVGTSNAVNLTDGLDGLVSGPLIFANFVFGFIATIVCSLFLAGRLNVPFVAGSGEVMIFAAATIGSLLGFLYFNGKPAMIFMGDVGSLALGGALGMMAVILKQEILLGFIGGLFVIEAISDMIQVTSFKYRHKRVFLMAPIHHHFEKKGWSERRVVLTFWAFSCLCALIGWMGFFF